MSTSAANFSELLSELVTGGAFCELTRVALDKDDEDDANVSERGEVEDDNDDSRGLSMVW